MQPLPIPIPDQSAGFEEWLRLDREKLKKGERTRLDLLLAAARHLADQPLESMTVAAMSQAAGVAHGTFYLYFKDRSHLAGEILSLFVDYLQIEMRLAARCADDPIRSSTAAYFTLFEANSGLMKCLVVGMDSAPEARQAFQRLNNEWARTVVRAQGRQRNPTAASNQNLSMEEQMLRAYALGAMVDQYLTALFVTKDPWIVELSKDPEATIDTLTTLWKKGMGA